MTTINMLEAKSSLSRLVKEIEDGVQSEIIIARNGSPAAKLVPLTLATGKVKRIGIAKGKFKVPESFDSNNQKIAFLFFGSVD